MKLFCECNSEWIVSQRNTTTRRQITTEKECPTCGYLKWYDADYENRLRNTPKIEGRPLTKDNIHDPVAFVPGHAEGNAGHKDCELGVIIGWNSKGVRVLYCKSRTIQLTEPESLVFG